MDQATEAGGNAQELYDGGRACDAHPSGIVACRTDHRNDGLHECDDERQNQRKMAYFRNHFSASIGADSPFHLPERFNASATSGGM